MGLLDEFLSGISETYDTLSGNERIKQRAKGYGNAFQQGLLSALPILAKQPQDITPEDAINSGLLGAIKVFHGSPHKFDAFDMSKIGTGEGAQAYGHGLYFAESPEVAKSYQDILTRKTTVNGQPIIDSNKITGSSGNDDIDNYLIAHHGDAVKAIESLKSDYDDFLKNAERGGYFDHYDKEYQNNINELQRLIDSNAIETSSGGNLYKISLQWPDAAKETSDPLGPQHFLDWEKPYSDQSEKIKEALQSIGFGRSGQTTGRNVYDYLQDVSREKTPVMVSKQFDDREAALNFYNEKKAAYSGKDQFKPLAQMSDGKFTVKYPEESQFNKSGYGPVEDASEYLRSIGIPGIRYLDGGSRGAGDGSYNYVVFDDKIPRIVKRNGLLE